MPNSLQAVYMTVIGSIIFLLSVGIAYVYNPVALAEVSRLEGFAVWTSYVCTVMVVAGMRLNFFFALLSTGAYALLFWRQNLLASAVLNVYLFPMAFFGLIMWSQPVAKRVTSVYANFSIPYATVVLGVSLLIYGITAQLVEKVGGTLPWLDSAILLLSIIAGILMSMRKLENWIVWIPLNIVAIKVYGSADLPLVTIQYWYFLLNAFAGLYIWSKQMKSGVEVAA